MSDQLFDSAYWLGHAELPIKLGFAMPLRSRSPGGLSTPEENAALGDVEDLICAEVSKRTKGPQVLTLTTGTVEEVAFYMGAQIDFAGIHTAIREQVSSHDVQCTADTQPGWDSYLAFTPGAE